MIHYSKTFYYRLAVVVDGAEPLPDVGEKEVLKQLSWNLQGKRTVKIKEQEVEIRPVALDLLPVTRKQGFDDSLGRLSRLVERMEAVPQSATRELLVKLRTWTREAIKRYGAVDIMGHLLQYLDELEGGG